MNNITTLIELLCVLYNVTNQRRSHYSHQWFFAQFCLATTIILAIKNILVKIIIWVIGHGDYYC